MPKDVERVFVLGPSHTMYTKEIMVSSAKRVEALFGTFTVDSVVVGKLLETVGSRSHGLFACSPLI